MLISVHTYEMYNYRERERDVKSQFELECSSACASRF